jgi:tricarboxylate carrier
VPPINIFLISFLSRTLPPDLVSEEKLWAAKELYDSAFHPQTGEKLFLPGRISFQVPGNMIITGCMLTFYKSTPAVIFWQWANQSFNALVNYTNRNASVSISNEQLGIAYALACTASVLTALGFNKIVAKNPRLSGGVIGRFVPLVAVAAANCINIPLMRQQEIKNGISIESEDGTVVGQSTQAAKDAILQVVPSRILMAVPGMTIPPIIMARLEKTTTFIKNPWLKAPTAVLMTGIALAFSTPLACALFPQNASIGLNDLEPALQTTVKSRFPGQSKFYYNKGL